MLKKYCKFLFCTEYTWRKSTGVFLFYPGPQTYESVPRFDILKIDLSLYKNASNKKGVYAVTDAVNVLLDETNEFSFLHDLGEEEINQRTFLNLCGIMFEDEDHQKLLVCNT